MVTDEERRQIIRNTHLGMLKSGSSVVGISCLVSSLYALKQGSYGWAVFLFVVFIVASSVYNFAFARHIVDPPGPDERQMPL